MESNELIRRQFLCYGHGVVDSVSGTCYVPKSCSSAVSKLNYDEIGKSHRSLGCFSVADYVLRMKIESKNIINITDVSHMILFNSSMPDGSRSQ